jgi:hypothetical protein
MTRIPSTTTRLLALGLLCLAAPSAGAQERGAIEIGAAVRWMTFDVSHRLQDKVGLAGHVGIFPLRDVSIEGQVSQHRTSVRRESGQDVKHRTSYVRALFHRPLLGRTALHVGGGYAFASYHGLTGESDHGIGAVIGIRSALTSRLGLRIDGTADYYPSPANATDLVDRNWNYGLQIGGSFLWGRLAPSAPPPPPDADGDGVVDAEDRCPGTAMGERVNAAGCPQPGDDGGPTNATRGVRAQNRRVEAKRVR